MSNYRRLISYIYAYEGGKKGRNTGYAKIEVRDGRCKIHVNVKNVYVGSNDIAVYLLVPGHEIILGKIFIRSGLGEFRANVSADNVENSGFGSDQCYGLTIHDVGSTWQCYTTIWDDAVSQSAEIQLADITSEKAREKEGTQETEPRKSIAEEIARELEEEEQKLAAIAPWDEVHAAEHVKTAEPEKRLQNETAAKVSEAEPAQKTAAEEKVAAAEKTAIKPEISEKPETAEKTETAEKMEMAEKTEAAEKVEAADRAAAAEVAETTEAEETTEEEETTETEKITEAEETETEEKVATAENAAMPDKAAPENTYIPEPGNPQQLEELERMEKEAAGTLSVWEQMANRHVKILAFDYDNGCEILSIKPQDIGLLPREIWVYGNNSFLLHGYYNYRHLILARLNNPQGQPRYLLGVPGHYFSNEKYMASMFGFPHFVLARKQPEEDGRFGYWYTDIRL